MRNPEAVIVEGLFPGLADQLLGILVKLTPQEWGKPTGCPGWSVKDVALHLLGVEVGVLSRDRDKEQPWMQVTAWEELVTFVNRQNDLWIEATRRISTRLLCEFLRASSTQVGQFFASLDPDCVGPIVDWAGPKPAPMWLHIAREYTERWHHQQQIREAVGYPLLTQPTFFAPVLATFAHAFPRAYHDLGAEEGTVVKISIRGDSGGDWYLVREQSTWLLSDAAPIAHSEVTFDQYDAWRLFTKSLTKDEVIPRVRIQGNPELALKALDTVSIIA